MSERAINALSFFERHKDFAADYVKNGIETNRKGYCRVVVKDKDGKRVPGAMVTAVQKTHDFKFGCNIFMLDEFENEEKNAIYREEFAKHFNYATVPFYWSDLEPAYGKPRYEIGSPKVYRRPSPDLCVQYCKENGIRMKGHCLAYDTSCFSPDYLPDDDRAARKLYDKHFKEISERYADDIDDWDITNELLCPDVIRADKPNIIKAYDYLEWVYDIGKKYFPYNTRLINEAAELGDRDFKGNRTPYYMLVERMIGNGAPVNAVSMQAHSFVRREAEKDFSAYRYNPVYIAAQMKLYTDFRLPLQISEVTLPAYSLDAEDERVQAELVRNMYSMWFASPLMEGIVYWNLVDGYAAFAPQGTLEGENYYCGGLIRYDMSKKPALEALDDLIASWHTEETVETNADGEAVFKGFYGNYDVKVTSAAGEKAAEIHVDKYYERPKVVNL